MDEGTFHRPQFDPWHAEWRVEIYRSIAISGIVFKHIAKYLPERESLNLEAAVASAVGELDREMCGNGWLDHQRGMSPPPPPPDLFETIAQLNAFAAGLPRGAALRASVADAAGALAECAGAAIRAANGLCESDAIEV